MKRNPNYFLTEIKGKTHLLPYGQAIVDYQKGLEINETGAFIWNQLKDDISLEDLVQRMASEYEVEEGDFAYLRDDAKRFVNLLIRLGAVLEESSEDSKKLYETHMVSTDVSTKDDQANRVLIGRIPVNIYCSQENFPKEFTPFQSGIEGEFSDINIRVLESLPNTREKGINILSHSDLHVAENEEYFLLSYPRTPYLFETRIYKSQRRVEIYGMFQGVEERIETLFHAIRLPFLFYAMQDGIYAIHSASILYNEKAWLFTGPSGTGKSTHTALWQKLYQVSMINGDLNLIVLQNGKPMVYGLPWCGTSGISSTEEYELGGIVVLKQDDSDYVIELSSVNQVKGVLHRLISPTWTAEQVQTQITFCEQLVSKILVVKLCCTKGNSAAEVIKEYIDQND